MNIFLALVLYFTTNILTTIYARKNLNNFTANPELGRESQFHNSAFNRHRFHSKEDQYIYTQTQPFHNERNYYLLQKFPHPHKYLYMRSLEKFNPSIQYENQRDTNRREIRLKIRDIDSKSLLRYDNGMQSSQNSQDRLTQFNHRLLLRGKNVLSSGKYLNHNRRNSRNSHHFRRITHESVGELSSTYRRDDKRNRHPIDLKKHSDFSRTINEKNIRKLKRINISTTNIFNETMNPSMKEKREASKIKESSSLIREEIYHNLNRFDLLYLLGLFLILIFVLSLKLAIVPASICWNACKKRKGSTITVEENLKEITVKSALLSDTNTKPAVESKSFKDIYGTFISNDFDGEGDTVAKRMKLERWMMQDFSSQKKFRSKYHRNFNFADMESVSEREELPVSSHTLENSAQSDTSGDASVESKVSPGDFPIMAERNHSNPLKLKGTKQHAKENKNESNQFSAPANKSITVGRYYNVGPRNPRHIYSFSEQRSMLPQKSHSMVHI